MISPVDAGKLKLSPVGDRALTITVGEGVSLRLSRLIEAYCTRLAVANIDGVLGWTPSYHSILVKFDPMRTDYATVAEAIEQTVQIHGDLPEPESRLVKIPVCYGGKHGPDLGFVARHTGMTENEVIALHTSVDYVVHFMGFSPGFPVLGILPPALATPRVASPRELVPAGSVGIGGSQTGVYPVSSPGGWQIIGQTPLKLYDPNRDEPTLLKPFDRVRFVPIQEDQFVELGGDQL